MTEEFLEWGTIIPTESEDKIPAVLLQLKQACEDNSSADFVEFRKGIADQEFIAIVDLGDATFDLNNPLGIQAIERFAMCYDPYASQPWDVRALRPDFPVTLHQNQSFPNEPRALCLYINNWKTVERSWNPVSFLDRIFWWLRATAEGTIHAEDQPIEQLFFASPYILLLPPDSDEKFKNNNYRLIFQPVHSGPTSITTCHGVYVDALTAIESNDASLQTLSFTIDPIDNMPISTVPPSLAELTKTFEALNSDLISHLQKAIYNQIPPEGMAVPIKKEKELLLMVVGIPRKRQDIIERIDYIGFGVDTSIGELGEILGVAFRAPNSKTWYRDTALTNLGSDVSFGKPSLDNFTELQDISIQAIHVREFPSVKDKRNMSGLPDDDLGPKGVIAGVGSLGSSLANIWNREGWGEWHLVDHDIIQAHNLSKHTAMFHHVGHFKTRAVRDHLNHTYCDNENPDRDYEGCILDDAPVINDIKSNAELVIDATTTLYVPRDLSEIESSPRTASVFFTPSGQSSVLLLEDSKRSIKASHLESQYYRAILTSEWGAHHLTGHAGKYYVGAGCREVSSAISIELVQIHSAIIARQLRLSVAQPDARMCIWINDDSTGAITPIELTVYPVRSCMVGGWKVCWDLHFEHTVLKERFSRLPNETGGILKGLVDHKTKSINIVDWEQEPEDSISTPATFQRGSIGQADIIKDCIDRTAGIVNHIGDWHSHPPGCDVTPSTLDNNLLTDLDDQLASSGHPALMVIIGEKGIGFSIGGDHTALGLAQ